MADWKMMSDFSIALPDRPGELARLAARMREADVNLLGLWGYGSSSQTARFYCVPESADQFRNFAESAGLEVQEGTTFFLTGRDRGGALVERLDRIALQGINLHAIEAIRVGDQFGCFIWADAADWPRLAEALDQG
ncbi:MAG: hypothetical protein KDA22_15530 [Phycisphaerales bacterium]|nr:hypothetical protein [Phycisphaerales bacterium]